MSELVKALSANVVTPVIPVSALTEWLKVVSPKMVTPVFPQSGMSELVKALSANVVTPVIPVSAMTEWLKVLSPKMVTPVFPQSGMSELVKALSANVVTPVIPQSAMTEWLKVLSPKMVTPAFPQSGMSEWLKVLSANVVTPVIPQSMLSEWVKALSQHVTMPKITDETLGAVANVVLAKPESSAWASAFAAATSTSGVSAFKATYADSVSSFDADPEPLEFAAAAVVATVPEAFDEETPNQFLGTAIVVLILWMVYCASPELRAALGFLDFPTFAAPLVWKALNTKKAE